VSGDTDTIDAVHTCAARFANWNDDAGRLLNLHRWHGLSRRREGQDKGNSNPSDHCFSPIWRCWAASYDAPFSRWITCEMLDYLRNNDGGSRSAKARALLLVSINNRPIGMY
jgi:hypothetical protein